MSPALRSSQASAASSARALLSSGSSLGRPRAGWISAAPLVIARVEFTYEPSAPDEDPEAGALGLTCFADDGNGAPNPDAPCGALDGQWAQIVPVGTENGVQTVSALPVHIVYHKFDDKVRTAKVKFVVQNAPDLAKGEFTVNVVAQPGKPSLELSKSELKWAFVKPGETDPAKQKQIAIDLQKYWVDNPTHINVGQWYAPMALRKNIDGILIAPVPVFWNVSKK